MYKKKIYTNTLIFLSLSDKIKLASKNGDVMNIYKKMGLILLVSYNTFIKDNKHNKKRMAGTLSENIRVYPSPVAVFFVAGSAAEAVTAAGEL